MQCTYVGPSSTAEDMSKAKSPWSDENALMCVWGGIAGIADIVCNADLVVLMVRSTTTPMSWAVQLTNRP